MDPRKVYGAYLFRVGPVRYLYDLEESDDHTLGRVVRWADGEPHRVFCTVSRTRAEAFEAMHWFKIRVLMKEGLA